MRAVALFTIAATVGSACASPGARSDLGGSGQTPAPTPSPTRQVPPPTGLIVTFDTEGGGPSAVVRFGDETREAFVGSHCWGKPFVEPTPSMVHCVDTVGPSSENLSPLLEVPSGTELVVAGTAETVEGSIAPLRSPFDPVTTLDLADGTAVIDEEPGEYVLSLLATWPHGSVPFFVGFEIAP